MSTQEELRVVLRTVADTNGALQVRRSLGEVRNEVDRNPFDKLGRGLEFSTESALRFVGALTGVEIGLSIFTGLGESIRSSIERSSEAFIESQRLARATTAAYGENADRFTRFAEALSRQTGFTRDSILQASLSARALSDSYGLTIDQTQQLIRVSADLAAAKGIGLVEAFDRVQAAARGEARSAVELGLALTDNIVKTNAANGAYRDSFDTLTETQKTTVRYQEILRQSANLQGLAAQSMQGLEGANRRAAVATEDFSRDLGQLLSPALTTARSQFTDATSAGDDFIKMLLNLQTVPSGPARQPLAPGQVDPRFRPTGLQATATPGPTALPPALSTAGVSDFSRAVDDLTTVRLPAAIRSAEDLHRAVDELTSVTLNAPSPERSLPRQIDESSKSADLSVQRLLRDMSLLTDQSGQLSTILSNLGPAGTNAGLQAQVRAGQDLLSIEQQLTARLGVGNLRQQLEEQTHVLDPRDAPGARVAQERLRLLDELEPRERGLIEAQRAQNDLQRQALQLQSAEAAATLRILPQREALQDLQAREQRDRLIVAARRVVGPEAASAARRDLRTLGRGGALAAAELAAFDANQSLTPLQRAAERNQLSGQIAAAGTDVAQQGLQDAVQRGVQAGIAEANQKPTQVTINITNEGTTSQVFDQLIEANGQAQTPPTIQVSAVRR